MRYDSTQKQRQEEQERVWRERREKEEEEARKEIRNKIGFKVLSGETPAYQHPVYCVLVSLSGKPCASVQTCNGCFKF